MADLDKIKEIQITQYIEDLGYSPIRKDGREWAYPCWWRNGDGAHLCVDVKNNLWHDKVSDKGGSIIDLVMESENLSFHDAVLKLDGGETSSMPTWDWKRPTKKVKYDEDFEREVLKQTRDHFTQRALIAYAEERGISLAVLESFCVEVFFNKESIMNPPHKFAIGFPNDSGGYAIRNKIRKGQIDCQGITTFDFAPDTDSWLIFEGFFDFLSFIQEYSTPEKVYQPKVNVIVLNSVVNLKRAYKHFKGSSRLYYMCDNDQQGNEYLERLRGIYASVTDVRNHFDGFKDYNQYWMNKVKGGKR